MAPALPEDETGLQQEIHLQNAMGVTMMAAKGWGTREVLQAFSKARALCEKLGTMAYCLRRSGVKASTT